MKEFSILAVLALAASLAFATSQGTAQPKTVPAAKTPAATAADDGPFNPPAVVSSNMDGEKSLPDEADDATRNRLLVSGQQRGSTAPSPNHTPANDQPPAPARAYAPAAPSGQTIYHRRGLFGRR